MKVLVVLHDYLPAHKGGSEIHAHQVARELARRGHDVTALFTERDLSAPEGEVRRGELDGVKTIEVVHQREYEDLRETWRQERSLARFRELLAELAPDVCHFHHIAIWGAACLTAARDAGARVVLTLHDYFALCDAATLLRTDEELCVAGPEGRCTDCLLRHPLLPERWGSAAEVDAPARALLYEAAGAERLAHHRLHLADAHHLVAPSRFLAERFEAAGFRSAAACTVLRYGYPGPVHPPRRRARAAPLRLGYVGGIYPSKGVHVLVDAMAELTRPDVELHVHGHLDWFPDYVARLRRRDDPRITWHGPFDPPRIDEVLAGIDVLVVPSIWYENMPLTISEAFRNGLPVVTTDLGGMREAVRDGVSGLTFPRGDARALAAALERLAADPDLYDRLAAGRGDVLSLETVVDRLEELYAGPPASG